MYVGHILRFHVLPFSFSTCSSKHDHVEHFPGISLATKQLKIVSWTLYVIWRISALGICIKTRWHNIRKWVPFRTQSIWMLQLISWTLHRLINSSADIYHREKQVSLFQWDADNCGDRIRQHNSHKEIYVVPTQWKRITVLYCSV